MQKIILLTLLHIDKNGFSGNEYENYTFSGFSNEDCYKKACDFVNKKWLDTVDLSIPSKGYQKHLEDILSEISEDEDNGDDGFKVWLSTLELEVRDDLVVDFIIKK